MYFTLNTFVFNLGSKNFSAQQPVDPIISFNNNKKKKSKVKWYNLTLLSLTNYFWQNVHMVLGLVAGRN